MFFEKCPKGSRKAAPGPDWLQSADEARSIPVNIHFQTQGFGALSHNGGFLDIYLQQVLGLGASDPGLDFRASRRVQGRDWV